MEMISNLNALDALRYFPSGAFLIVALIIVFLGGIIAYRYLRKKERFE